MSEAAPGYPDEIAYVTPERARLAAAIGIAVQDVSVKGKTNEGMGWIGRREGLAVMAVAALASG